MIGNVEFERKTLEQTYYDSATIYRSMKEKVNGKTKFSPSMVYENKPCAISKNSLPNNNQSDSVNSINYTITLFISPEIEVKQGDLIEIAHLGVTKKYIAGEPFKYVTHQEISLEREDRA